MVSEVDQDEPAKTAAAAFREGFAVPWNGFRYMNRHPSLWRYGVIPILLNLLITIFVLALLILGVIAFATYLHPKFAAGWFGVFLEILCAIGLFVLAIGVAAGTWVLLQGILCGHYYGKLAREVELQLGMRPEDIREISLGYHILDALRDFFALAGINTAFLMLNCIPVFGSIIALCGALYFNCYIFGRDYLDYPLALRGMRRKEKHQFARQHRAHTLGLGAVVLLFNLIPILGAVVLTTAATGAVLLYRRLKPATARSSSPGIPGKPGGKQRTQT